MIVRDSLGHIPATLAAKIENRPEDILWDTSSVVTVVGIEQPQKVGFILQNIVQNGFESDLELRLSSCCCRPIINELLARK